MRTLLAYAGLKRLGMARRADRTARPGRISAGTGAGRDLHREPGSATNASTTCSPPSTIRRTHEAVACERGFLATLDGSCRTPIAGLAVSDGTHLRFSGMILTPDGSTHHRITVEGKAADAEALGQKAGEDIRALAGPGFFSSWT